MHFCPDLLLLFSVQFCQLLKFMATIMTCRVSALQDLNLKLYSRCCFARKRILNRVANELNMLIKVTDAADDDDDGDGDALLLYSLVTHWGAIGEGRAE